MHALPARRYSDHIRSVGELAKLSNCTSLTDQTLTKKTNSSELNKPRRHRRKPEAAESEIVSAAEEFLKEFPLNEMTIDTVMSRTGLARPSFYKYFRDRNHLVMKLTEHLISRNPAIGEPWFGGNEPVEDLRHFMHEVVQLYSRHAHLLAALADAVINDGEAEIAYRRMLDTVVGGTTQRIRTDIARGRITLAGLDPHNLATALVLMKEGYLVEKIGRRPPADTTAVAKTLVAIWLRVLYGIVL